MVGCGILRREVEHVVQRRSWQVELEFFNSALHVHLGHLSQCLNHALCRHAGRDTVVFYGVCHPQIDEMMRDAHAVRTHGQNCIDFLLGPERFQRELESGAFFLLEDWARRWRPFMEQTWGPNWAVTREIFAGAHTHLLAVRTPCSGDFTAAAEQAAADLDLPLRWIDVDLDHLEAVLDEAFTRRLRARDDARSATMTRDE